MCSACSKGPTARGRPPLPGRALARWRRGAARVGPGRPATRGWGRAPGTPPPATAPASDPASSSSSPTVFVPLGSGRRRPRRSAATSRSRKMIAWPVISNRKMTMNSRAALAAAGHCQNTLRGVRTIRDTSTTSWIRSSRDPGRARAPGPHPCTGSGRSGCGGRGGVGSARGSGAVGWVGWGKSVRCRSRPTMLRETSGKGATQPGPAAAARSQGRRRPPRQATRAGSSGPR